MMSSHSLLKLLKDVAHDHCISCLVCREGAAHDARDGLGVEGFFITHLDMGKVHLLPNSLVSSFPSISDAYP